MRKAKARDTWISEPGFRHFFTDDNGVDHDIVQTIADLRMARVLLGAGKCPNTDCVDGGVPVQVADNDWEQEQCQWCYEKNKLLGELTDG